MWVEKYRPSLIEELVGNEDARLSFLKWLREWKREDKPLLLLGPPGTGKTTAVHAVARELGYSVVEMNASDSRTKKMLEDLVGSASGGVTVFGTRILLFLDEVDGLYSREDYGGLEFIIQFAKKPPIPVVMAANMKYDERIEKLARQCRTVVFRPVPPRLARIYLERVLAKERLKFDVKALDTVLGSSRGDMRAALNTLQAAIASVEGAKVVRDEELELPDCVNKVLASPDGDSAADYLNMCSSPPEEKLRAFHSTLLSGGVPVDRLAEALRALSDADVIYGRIMRTQTWRLLRYFNRVVGSEIHRARLGVSVSYSEYWLPWATSNKAWNVGMPVRNLASILAKYVHSSQKNFLLFYMPYLSHIFDDVKVLADVPGVQESMLKAMETYSGKGKRGMKDGD